jgi:AcrR family transcriptional regulator
MDDDSGYPIDSMRKIPRQQRAWDTIRTIFEATAQIIDRDGEEQLTTNRIADKAGFSIGTLYQYFPSMDAILLAMIDLHRQKVLKELDRLLAEAEASHLSPELFVRRFLRILIQNFGIGSPTLVRQGWKLSDRPVVIKAIQQIAERIQTALRQRNHPDFPPLDAARLFVMTRGVMGTIRSAVMENSGLLETPEFEDALLALSLSQMRRTA